ncbi:hypothetical protein BP00DRAFT_486880 [Aspergillus indologenus CBS 114.80]|uniref:ABM domain-containing protein n=1 Tax=Aspergillus indologenus CBS 114.80 TaxID=1450541 RepID=A0A2V5IR55_9EURO|nr:hypothetical protein BP00DRAFT_486880 [Aspergillus indologenus CBS 114.80]
MDHRIFVEPSRDPCLHGIKWTATALRDDLPKTPVLSLIRFKFRPEADFMDEQHVAHTLWQQSLVFISTVSGFQRLLWAPISDESRRMVLLIQWRDGTAWQEFQLSFGLGLLLPLLQEVPPLNQSVTLILPPYFAAGPGHFLELVELSVKLAENEYDPAERSRWIKEEWQAVVESLGTAPSDSSFPGLVCGSGGWFEEQLPLESRTFLGLLLWRTPRDAITWTPHQTVRHNLQALIGHTIRQSSLVTASMHECSSLGTSLAARSSASLASLSLSLSLASSSPSSASLAAYSGTIFQTLISPPRYTSDKDFEYQTRFDVRARKSIDDVASRRRICPSPEAIWCPMGAMGQGGFPTFQDVPSQAAAPTVDVLWLQLNNQHPETLSLVRRLRLAIHNSLGSPRLRWGRETSQGATGAGVCRMGILIEWKKAPPPSTWAQLYTLVDEVVSHANGTITRSSPSITRYCASIPTDQPCHLELHSLFLVDAECPKRILWHAYQRFTSTMSCPTARAQVYIHPSPTLAARPVAHGFHDEGGFVRHPRDHFAQQPDPMIRFSAGTVWASAAAREEWYADFADQAASCYERLGYIVDWVQLVAESAESVVLELEPVDAEVLEWWKSGRHQAMSR